MESENKNNAVLVGIQLPRVSNEEFESSLLELTRLVKTLGYNTVGTVTQKRASNKLPTVLGAGKLQELAQWTGGSGKLLSLATKKLHRAGVKRLNEQAKEDEEQDSDSQDKLEDLVASQVDDPLEDEFVEGDALKDKGSITEEQKNSAQIVVVDTDLSPSQIRNLESVTGVKVLDRTGIIIEIFSKHAHTRAARLQVKIAKLTYMIPRIREAGVTGDRQGGGVGGKGSGEKQFELDKRKVRDAIKELKAELDSIGDEHLVRRARRAKVPCVALVGYTNAGKSSLMRAMTNIDVLVEDKLFATLDTTIRPLAPETMPKILISDTVGFIKQLPHDLVASFKSTLDEALNASLLLFIVDASDPSFRSQLKVTQSVLEEVGAGEIPRLTLLNKRDRLTQEQITALKQEYPDAIMISAHDKSDQHMLREKILTYFEKDMKEEDIFIPFTAKGIIGEIRKNMRVINEKYSELGTTFTVRSTEELLSQIKRKLLLL